MKAIKITTADGKSITTGHEDASWIKVDYTFYPEANISDSVVHAGVLQANRETIIHGWGNIWGKPSEKPSPVVKFEIINTETLDSPLIKWRSPIDEQWGKRKVSLFKRLLYVFSMIFGNTQTRNGEKWGPICSFCGKYKSDVQKLIEGPGVNICHKCVGLCDEILSEEYGYV